MSKKHEDEDNANPQPFYHETENFSSAYFGQVPEHLQPTEGKADKQLMANIVSLITDPRNREHKEDALALLRKHDARQLLVDMLDMKEYAKYRKELLETCWESGLDFSNWLPVFVNFLFDQDDEIVLEASTVISEMPGPFSPENLAISVEKLTAFPAAHALYPMVSTIHRKISATE